MRFHPGVKLGNMAVEPFSLAVYLPVLLTEDSSEWKLSGNRCCSTICLERCVPQEWLSFRTFGKEQHLEVSWPWVERILSTELKPGN